MGNKESSEQAYIDYWKKRALDREAVYQGGSEKTIAAMRRAYNRAFENIEAQISSAIRNLEAKGGAAAPDADAYYHRIETLEALQDNVYNELKKLESIERRTTGARYAEVMAEGYNRTMFDIQKGVGLAFDFAKLPKKAIEETLLSNWKGRNYSKSIWQNTEKLAGLAEEIIKGGLLSGAPIQTMVAQLDSVMGTGQFLCERLIRTETNYFANQGELRSYEQAGIEYYDFLATLDAKTSKTCAGLDGEKVPVADAEVGRNYPPMHAFCRSTTVAHFDDSVVENLQRRARDPITGRTVVLDGNINYGEWYDTYVKGKPEAEAAFYAQRNKAADTKQFEKYKELLGDNVPETLADFQSLKYNDAEGWSTLKDYYKAISAGSLTPLASLDDYTAIKRDVEEKLVGITTANGIRINSYSAHFIDRVIGSIEQRRNGVEVEDVKQILLYPVKIDNSINNKNGRSQRFIGQSATASVNPDIGNLIQVNPKSVKR